MKSACPGCLDLGPVKPILGLAAALLAACTSAGNPPGPRDDAAERHYYNTGGVHNNKDCGPANNYCIAQRKPGEPSDPQFPQWWTSEWTMYRVFRNEDKYPPPYSSPPTGLTPADYEVSYGASYYDDSYVPADGDGRGAMMEYYDKRCLPIFPMKNDFSCSFVSLGNKAYFLRYSDRPPGTPACCQFSLMNHPPRRDFIKHLPYDAARSEHLGGTIQAYAQYMGGPLFGYAFEKTPTPDSYDPSAPPYRHPQSFFFSGDPGSPPDAPIVSQNYSNFRMQKPDPAKTWAQVPEMCTPRPEWCCLFTGDCPENETEPSLRAARPGSQWNKLGKPGERRQ